jgi:hypothetical protein
LYRISGFQIDKSKVEKIVNSQSFSIYSSGEIELFLTNPTHQRSFKLSTTGQGWTHFTLAIVKHNVLVLQNGKVVFDKAVDFEPNAIAFKRAKESYWKVHECKYFENIIVHDAVQLLGIQISLDGQIRVQLQTKHQLPLPFHPLQKNVYCCIYIYVKNAAWQYQNLI